MRMKIILLCCLMAGLFAKQVRSSHVYGGEIYYECLNPFIGAYLFTVKLYRDCYTGVPPFDDPIFVSIYTRDTSGNFVLYIQMDMVLPPPDTLENNTYNFCLYAPPNICVEEAVYQQAYFLPPGKYYFTYQRCCRNQGILNIPNPTSVGFGFDIVVPVTNLVVCNSSPYYNNYPPTIICLDAPFEYDHSATDPDGDSLVYYLCAPNDYDYFTWGIVPNPSGPPNSNITMDYINPPFDSLYPITAPVDSFKIDPVTGLMTGTPTQAGRYVVAVCVSEYRNGQLLSTNSRDFQFNIAYCLDDPLLQYSWAPDLSDPCMINFTYQGNTVVSFDWNFGVDSITSDTSDLENPSYTFPGAGTYTVSLVVNKAYWCADTLDIDVTVGNCSVVSVPESESDNENQLHLYPNPVSGSFTLYLEADDNQGDIQIHVYHMDGTQVLKKIVATPQVDTLHTLDLRGASKGIYLLKVETGKEILTKRLIVL
ncbi:MAG TPA: T9SS type A sorting domain-containing protein [Flavobacteriales bacterium]|nr:T9SS type A sorting domain-containing protein [Flavobacteriales bacterium]